MLVGFRDLRPRSTYRVFGLTAVWRLRSQSVLDHLVLELAPISKPRDQGFDFPMENEKILEKMRNFSIFHIFSLKIGGSKNNFLRNLFPACRQPYPMQPSNHASMQVATTQPCFHETTMQHASMYGATMQYFHAAMLPCSHFNATVLPSNPHATMLPIPCNNSYMQPMNILNCPQFQSWLNLVGFKFLTIIFPTIILFLYIQCGRCTTFNGFVEVEDHRLRSNGCFLRFKHMFV